MNAKKIYAGIEGAMPEKMGERMDLFLNKKNISRAEFGRACGTSGTTSVSNYIDGKSKPNAEFIALAAKNFDLNPMWLLLGQGPMFLSEAGQECPGQVKEAPADYKTIALELKHELADKDRELAAIERAMGKQQGLIFEAVFKTCRELGLSPDQTRALQWAVMDYEGAQDSSRLAEQDDTVSHQKAVGD